MKREIITTADGSTTIHIPDWNEQYHSKHGAIQEAYHVFIKSGLDQISSKGISILEIGLGTGLNCFITYLEGKKRKLHIDYVGVEAYPISDDEFSKLNYVSELKSDKFDIFNKIHVSNWDEKFELAQNFSLLKRKQLFQNITDINCFDLIYFDAFGARVQPELWSVLIFQKMYKALKDNGVLVTYSAKGSVRRAMIEVGFTVEKLPGPPGKREMLR
ncbi:MAG: tRNA (5-methylaminomethyl-2-thiouridine)(34)-methyltransferase MnmD, partial [Flavobacteriaceae bacterium]|nr:tRNA (5-methylaminomethyl-2-thiouridine)(34)-methyltransferase MnmD [Flavobacteriaceae bacterium]